jgi:hypothetical protein
LDDANLLLLTLGTIWCTVGTNHDKRETKSVVLLTLGTIWCTGKAAMIRQMIRLADTIAAGDTNVVSDIKTEMGPLLTDELIAAASYGRFKAYNDLPPAKENSSPAVPKDKMKAAREAIALKNPFKATAAPPTGLPKRARASPQGA